MEQWQLTFSFNSLKYLHSLVIAHPALPGAARAPLGLQGRQCSPKWASQHSTQQPQQPSPASPFPKATVLLQTPTLSSWAGELMVLTQLQPLGAPGSRAGLSHGGDMQNIQGLWQLPLGFTCKGNISTSPRAQGCGTAGSDTQVTGGARTALYRMSSQLLSGSGHAVGATHSIHTQKEG